MVKSLVFVSFDYDQDRRYRDLLRAWNANPEFDFFFEETSPRVAVNSTEAAVIKRVLSQRIARADYLLCIVGPYTYASDWVTWEIEKAKESKKRIVAVKLDRQSTTPTALYGSGGRVGHELHTRRHPECLAPGVTRRAQHKERHGA